ncbi:hypothetical protein [Microtetraspora malaysiensis]|uniref:Uncharacterized protein n=1 Tax=Microtetraspora malaysiensis TaxID=161358 RepID=A0ABW6T369_9ACTN
MNDISRNQPAVSPSSPSAPYCRLGALAEMTGDLDGLAGALSLAGRHGRAARLLGAAAASRASGTPSPGPAERADIDRITTRVRTALGEERADAGA